MDSDKFEIRQEIRNSAGEDSFRACDAQARPPAHLPLLVNTSTLASIKFKLLQDLPIYTNYLAFQAFMTLLALLISHERIGLESSGRQSNCQTAWKVWEDGSCAP
jgi:hypothetical protein